MCCNRPGPCRSATMALATMVFTVTTLQALMRSTQSFVGHHAATQSAKQSKRASLRARQSGDGLVVVEPQARHSATVIWLHGLGDTGEGWMDVGPQLQMKLPFVRFLFPTAPTQPVTVNMGISMPSWFDINSLEPELFKLNPKGLKESAEYVRSLMKEELAAGISSDRVVLVGFSQGGAVVLEAALGQGSEACGAVLVLSSFVGSALPAALSPATEVHFFHGEADQVVPISWGQRSFKELEAKGLKPSFKSYAGMPHSACAEELQDIAALLSAVLGSE